VEDPVTVNLLGNLTVKEYLKSVYICRSYDQKSNALLAFLTITLQTITLITQQ